MVLPTAIAYRRGLPPRRKSPTGEGLKPAPTGGDFSHLEPPTDGDLQPPTGGLTALHLENRLPAGTNNRLPAALQPCGNRLPAGAYRHRLPEWATAFVENRPPARAYRPRLPAGTLAI